jgi:hypothetical protein
MAGRNHVEPPGSALAPNVAPGREFWTDWEGEDAGQRGSLTVTPFVPDLSKPNLTRLAVADHLYAQFFSAGQDAMTARTNADAQALAMIP